MKQRHFDFLLAIFFGFIVFWVFPMLIFFPNREDFCRDWLVVTPFVFLLVFYAAAVYFLTRYGRPSRFWRWLFFLGLFFVLKDIFSPLRMAVLIGLNEAVATQVRWYHSFAEITIIVGLLAVNRYATTRFINQVLLPGAMALIVTQHLFWGWEVSRDLCFRGHKEPALHKRTAVPADRGNVYLICLDSFVGRAFSDLIDDASLRDEFAGFTYFPKNLSNYDFTWPSLASVLSGELHPLEANMREWYVDSLVHGGLLSAFAASGYDVWSYSGEKHDAVTLERFVPRSKQRSLVNSTEAICSAWIVRLAPAFMKTRLFLHFDGRRKSFFRQTSDLIVASLAQLERFADDENTRPCMNQFVYVHVYLPHNPFCFDRNGRQLLAEGSFGEQAICALRPVVRFLRTLKARKMFEGATVVIFGDHGLTHESTAKYRSALYQDYCAVGNEAVNVPDLLSLSALLLAKGPGMRMENPLRVSATQTQNCDIPATLANLTGLNTGSTAGICLLPDEVKADRSIDIYTGFGSAVYQKIKQRHALDKSTEGMLAHYRLNGRVWERLSDTKCVWRDE